MKIDGTMDTEATERNMNIMKNTNIPGLLPKTFSATAVQLSSVIILKSVQDAAPKLPNLCRTSSSSLSQRRFVANTEKTNKLMATMRPKLIISRAAWTITRSILERNDIAEKTRRTRTTRTSRMMAVPCEPMPVRWSMATSMMQTAQSPMSKQLPLRPHAHVRKDQPASRSLHKSSSRNHSVKIACATSNSFRNLRVEM